MLFAARAQTMSKHKADQFLQRAWNDLRTSDSASFTALWKLNASALQHEGRPMSKQFIVRNFDFMKQFLDTALRENLKMRDVEIEEVNLEGTDTKYWVRTWFKYNKHFYKGFGFYLAYADGQWVVRGSPSTSTMRRIRYMTD
jgi:hypothetical protein